MPLRERIAGYLDPLMVTERELTERLALSGIRPAGIPARQYYRVTYTWGTAIPVNDSKVWLLLSAYLTGTATATFQPRMGYTNRQNQTVGRILGGQVDQNDGYEILFAPGVTQQSAAVLAGIPNQYVAVEIPENLLIFGSLTFTAAAAGVPEASTPTVTLEFLEYDLER